MSKGKFDESKTNQFCDTVADILQFAIDNPDEEREFQYRIKKHIDRIEFKVVISGDKIDPMTAGEVPVEVTIDTSQGYSVVFEDDGFLLFEGEYDDSTYPLVTATVLTQEVYDKYIEDNKDNDTLREDDGFIKYTSSIGELACLWKIGDVVPFLMTFEKSVDGDRADEIIGCMEMDAIQ